MQLVIPMSEFHFNEHPEKKDKKGIPTNVEKWTWKHFVQYYDTLYSEYTNRVKPGRDYRDNMKLKVMTESSISRWGKPLLKEMIEWLFRNYKDYPQWDLANPSLVMAKHGWSNMIADKAQQVLESKEFAEKLKNNNDDFFKEL